MRSRMESMDCDMEGSARVQRPPSKAASDRRMGGRNRRGQGTVEYALVTVAFLAIALCLGVLWRFIADGGFASGVVDSLTHRLAKGMADIVLF